MSIAESIGLWGSIASIVGLLIAFIKIATNDTRITRIERAMHVYSHTESESRADSDAKATGGTQTAKQSIGTITQSVAGLGPSGLQRTTCPHLPNGDNEVNASIVPATAVVKHVICSKLQPNYTCQTETNAGENCIVISPEVIRAHRNTLAAREDD